MPLDEPTPERGIVDDPLHFGGRRGIGSSPVWEPAIRRLDGVTTSHCRKPSDPRSALRTKIKNQTGTIGNLLVLRLQQVFGAIGAGGKCPGRILAFRPTAFSGKNEHPLMFQQGWWSHHFVQIIQELISKNKIILPYQERSQREYYLFVASRQDVHKLKKWLVVVQEAIT